MFLIVDRYEARDLSGVLNLKHSLSSLSYYNITRSADLGAPWLSSLCSQQGKHIITEPEAQHPATFVGINLGNNKC